MSRIAIVDATHHGVDTPPSLLVAGLSLLERGIRLAHVSSYTHIVLLAFERDEAQIRMVLSGLPEKFSHNISICIVPDAALAGVLSAVHAHVGLEVESLLWMRSSTVYDRAVIREPTHALEHPDNAIVTVTSSHDDKFADAIGFNIRAWERFIALSAAHPSSTLGELIQLAQKEELAICNLQVNAWQRRIETTADARLAEEFLWNSCRKDVDGIVARYINRNISLAISRRIARFPVSPNMVSGVTFSLGIIAALLAAQGGYWGFLAAGIVYQVNSIVDGVDGEIARVKYEFSLLGEWLDTLSDDVSDLLFYIGLSWGAFHTFSLETSVLKPEYLFLTFGGLAIAGKLLSMLVYYRWLIANKRGDLLAFQWSFEEPAQNESESALKLLLKNSKYLFKKDFIVFVAMLLGFLGVLPWFLLLLGPGNCFVFISVIVQQITHSKKRKKGVVSS